MVDFWRERTDEAEERIGELLRVIGGIEYLANVVDEVSAKSARERLRMIADRVNPICEDIGRRGAEAGAYFEGRGEKTTDE